MCTALSSTNATSPPTYNCNSAALANIYMVGGNCALGATSQPSATTLNGYFALNYTNLDASTNGGVNSLVV